MKTLVYVYTFPKNQNQGITLFVKAMELEVYTENMPLIIYNGCLSGRIIRNEKVNFVKLCGQEFIAGKITRGAKWFVRVPWDVAESIKNLCPHCGKSITENGIKQRNKD